MFILLRVDFDISIIVNLFIKNYSLNFSVKD